MQLTKDCQLGSRHLNRLLCTWARFSAKQMARIVRFQVLLQRIETRDVEDWPDLPAELGYYDQSHLTNEVAQFAVARTMHVATIWRIVPRRAANRS